MSPSATRQILSPFLLFLAISSNVIPVALADQHRSSITSQERRTARDLFDNRSEDLSGLEQHLLREIRSGSKESLSKEERELFDRIKRKLPDLEGSGEDD